MLPQLISESLHGEPESIPLGLAIALLANVRLGCSVFESYKHASLLLKCFIKTSKVLEHWPRKKDFWILSTFSKLMPLVA